jgi:hypothetical protein
MTMIGFYVLTITPRHRPNFASDVKRIKPSPHRWEQERHLYETCIIGNEPLPPALR